ncbi:MAG: TatD family hydrolase [Flavobacteriales bacterium]|nr:TatD family hydrolase [Flavobacteriales bacterium]MBX2958993.1 TatD family hydrolase [Flavobacteriales bacterium]MCL4855653.1 TatD family hydrolase [Flavobacteriales bacterium]
MILTDTHSHLYSEQFNDDRTAMVQRAIDCGVSRLFLPNIDSSSIEGMLVLQKQFPENCFAMMGLHPTSVNENYLIELKNIETQLNQQKFCAIGEIGIDLYWDKTFLTQQQEAFKTQINWAKERNLPFVIHCRDSFNEIFEILDEMKDDNMRGIFHCFTGNLEQAKKIIAYGGFKLGIGGVVTFKNSGLEEVLKNIAITNLVLETDSPYLAPVPYRGKRNESSYIVNVAEKLSDIYQIPIEKIAEITTQNSIEVFGF